MSDLAATNCNDCGCGCDSGCGNNSCGCNGGCNNGCGCNNGWGTSLFGGGGAALSDHV